MLTLLDYIYFRWISVYRGHDKDPEIYAILSLTLYETLTIVNVVSIVCIITGVERPDGLFIIPLTFILGFLNYSRYQKIESNVFETRWKDEGHTTKRIRFYLMISYLIVVFVAPWIYGYIIKAYSGLVVQA